MDNSDAKSGATAETAEAESITAAAAPEKFKDVGTLLKAYSSLEAEFTRRSQRLKELEQANKAGEEPDGAQPPPSPLTESELIERALKSAAVRDAVIAEYLRGAATARSAPVTSGGGGVSAPAQRPRSVKEAGSLAARFLK